MTISLLSNKVTIMRYYALVTDFDGTLASDDVVEGATIAALERFRSSGRVLIMATGREVSDLKRLFLRLDLFEWVVAENGAVLYCPANEEIIYLAEPPVEAFITELRNRGMHDLKVGNCILSTFERSENLILSAIRDMGLELKVVFNKGAIMVLPSNINKATGILAALNKLNLSAHEIIGVGDAENDHAFLNLCECSAAVANALPSLKEHADIVLQGACGDGVVELIDKVIANDLRDSEEMMLRNQILLGKTRRDSEVHIKPYDNAMLIAGPSRSGKSTVATGLMERLHDQGYQYCIIDPEGDFATFKDAIVMGGADQPPSLEEVMSVLKNPSLNVIVNMIGVRLSDRPTFFQKLLGRLLEFRGSFGRPHWILVDEAHHLLPSQWKPTSVALPQELNRLILITVHPGEVSSDILALTKSIVAVGPEPKKIINEYCLAVGDDLISEKMGSRDISLENAREVYLWTRDTREGFFFKPAPSSSDRRRHVRKYMSGELPPDQSFYFRGPEGKLNLRAQNLMLFMQIADGVDL